MIADALVLVQNNDRFFNDGRLRNGYASGDLLAFVTSSGCLSSISNIKMGAIFPGNWNKENNRFEEDEYAVGSDVGNLSWAGIALIQAHTLLSNDKHGLYLTASEKIANWIIDNHKINDKYGGFRGGFEGFESKRKSEGQRPSQWRSSEHNIDLYVLFSHLATVGKRNNEDTTKWEKNAEHAKIFIEKMWNKDGYYSGGTNPPNGIFNTDVQINKSIVPLDVQTWSALALDNQRSEEALDWALKNCGAKNMQHGFDFDCGDLDGACGKGRHKWLLLCNGLIKNIKPFLFCNDFAKHKFWMIERMAQCLLLV